MSKDILSDKRKKCKFIFEARFPAKTSVIDERGKTISKITEAFKKKVKHWKVENVGVHIFDELEKPQKSFYIDHKTCRMQYEDVNTLEEFKNDANNFCKHIYEIYNNELKFIDRMGVRFLCTYHLSNYKNFEEIYNKIKNSFLASSFPLKIQPNDIQLTFNYSNGSYMMGPFKKEEPFLLNSFNNILNIPEFGLYLDIDSFISEINCDTSKNFIDIFNKVLGLTIEMEKDILSIF